MPNESRTKNAWRDYLRGKYLIKNQSFKNKMRHEIRERAESFMSDLLLIAQKASERDKVLIFKNPKTRKSLVIPLIIALENTSQRMHDNDELEEAMSLGEQLQIQGINFDVPLLVRSESYRQKKHVELLCKWGMSRKYARDIATVEVKKRYPKLFMYPSSDSNKM